MTFYSFSNSTLLISHKTCFEVLNIIVPVMSISLTQLLLLFRNLSNLVNFLKYSGTDCSVTMLCCEMFNSPHPFHPELNLLAREEKESQTLCSVGDEERSGRQCEDMWWHNCTAPFLTRRLFNCFKWLPISVHDELLQASVQNLTELVLQVEQIHIRYSIPFYCMTDRFPAWHGHPKF